MISLRRFLLCCGIALLGASAWGDEIRNWSAPPYWSGPVRARAPEESRVGIGTEAAEAAEVLPTAAVPFVAIVPCRIVDTRGNGFTGAYGPPALAGGATAREFNVPAGPCPGIPADAAAFSINIGAILPAADGFLTAYPTGGAQPTVSNVNFLANEVIANAAVIGAGTSGSISIFVNVTTHMIIDINGYYAGGVVTKVNDLSGDVTLAAGSNVTITPSGQTLTVAATGGPGGLLPAGSLNQTLRHNGTSWVASNNLSNDESIVGVQGILRLPDPQTRVNAGASQFLYSDTGNLFLGTNAGVANAGGDRNTGIGNLASLFNTTGTDNTGVGYRALNENLSGNSNTAVGSAALDDNDSGSSNIAIGYRALSNISTGNSNIGIGVNVGTNISSGSNNIYIGNAGFNNESGQVRIGTVGSQVGVVVVGISGQGTIGGAPVYVNAGGRLGTDLSSSRRFKEEIRDIAVESDGLMKLRPVAFRYKPEFDPAGLAQYGLIAEEVAEVYPDLVTCDGEGQPVSVRYHLLEPLLLNEMQKQRRSIEVQQAEIENLRAELARLQAQLAGTGVVRQ
jgi:hypothetical protein